LLLLHLDNATAKHFNVLDDVLLWHHHLLSKLLHAEVCRKHVTGTGLQEACAFCLHDLQETCAVAFTP
jgi:hypothetical protein